MAKNDVQINIIGKDMATSAFRSVSQAANTTSRDIDSLGNSAIKVNTILQSMLGFAVAQAGMEGLSDAFHASIGNALDYYKTMQTGQIAVAGTLMSVGSLNGKQIEWNQSLQMSTQIMKDLSDQAIRTGVSTQSFVSVFRAALPAALKSGMNIPQFEELLGPLMTEGKMLELPEVSLVRDVSDLLLGNNANRTKLANVLGITDTDIKNAKSQNKLYDLLHNRLQGELMSNKQYLGTWEGTTNYMKEALSRAGGTAAAPAFEKMKEDIHDIADSLIHVDQETKEITLDPTAQKAFREISDDAIALEGQFRLIGSDLATVFTPALEAGAYAAGFLARNLDTVARIYAAYFVASKIKAYWIDYQNGITGAAKANTFFGKTAEATRAQILAQEAAALRAKKALEEESAGTSVASTSKKVTSVSTSTASTASAKAEQKNLAEAVTSTNVVLTNQVKIGTAAGTAISQGSAEAKVAQGELTAQALATSEALNTQSKSAATAAEVSAAGSAKAKAAQAEVTTAVLTGAAAHATNAEVAKVGITSTLGQMDKLKIGMKAALAGIWALAGGWIGVATAAAMALSAYNDYLNKAANYKKEHTHYVNGMDIYKDENGDFYRRETVTENNPLISDKAGPAVGTTQREVDVKLIPTPDEIEQWNLFEDANKAEKDFLEQQKISAMAKDTSKSLEDKIAAVMYNPNLPNSEDEEAQNKAQEAAEKAASAQQQYANTISSNANLIEKANEKMRDIMASLEEQLMNFTGSQYDIDMASAKKQYLANIKSINDDSVKLKTVNLSTLRNMNSADISSGSGNDMVSIIKQAAEQLGVDPNLALAVAMRESGGDTLSGINNGAYNESSGATGAFQILDGQDVSDGNGGRAAISDLYPDYKTDPTQNALAGITMLIDKINTFGDTWEGVKHYGEDTEEYVEAVRQNYEALQGGVNLAPTSYQKYTPDGSNEAKGLSKTVYNENMNKATRDWLIRVRKQYSETAETNMALPDTENRAGLIAEKYREAMAEAEDKRRDLMKSVEGDSSDPKEKARAEAQVQAAIKAEQEKAQHEEESSLRDLRQKEYDEQKSYLDSMAYLSDDYQAHTDELQAQELKSIIDYDADQLKNAKLTQSERISLEEDYVSKKKELEDIEKKNFDGGLKYMYRQMRLYTQDAGTALADGWNTISSDITSSFDNMLTENESGAKRLENLYVNIGNTILNTMMKIILQGLIMNSIMKAFGIDTSGDLLSTNTTKSISSLNLGTVSSGFNYKSSYGIDYNAIRNASGGYITGPGTSTSDSIPSYLSNGEYVVSAKGVQSVGTSFLDAINKGYVKRFANGGAVSGGTVSAGGSTPNVKVNIVNQTGSQISAENTNVSVDGDAYVMGIVLKSLSTNKYGSRSALKGLVK